MDPLNKAFRVELVLAIKLSDFLFDLKFLKAKTAFNRILDIRAATQFISHFMRHGIFMYFNITVLSELSHLDFQSQAVQGVPERRLDVHYAIVDKDVLKVGLETNNATTNG